MPRAYDAATIDPSVRHRRAEVRAVLADREDVVAVAMQDHADAVDLHPSRLTVQRRDRQHRCPVVDLQAGTRVIDTDTGAVHERPAQIAASHGDAVAQRSPCHSTEVTAAPTVPPRHRVQRGSDGVQQTVHNPDPAGLLVGVLPVGRAGRGGPQTPDDPHAKRKPGRLPHGLTASGQHARGVQCHRRRHRAGRHGRQRRVQRMTQPGPVQRVAHVLPTATQRGEDQCQRVFEPVTGAIQPLLAPEV